VIRSRFLLYDVPKILLLLAAMVFVIAIVRTFFSAEWTRQTFSFVITAPVINEVALVLLFGLFGWQVASLYVASGLSIAIIAGPRG
jgi:uncharacterized membrane protein YraQ (UPF0718 family)